jgi:hypothetical protein
MTHPSTERLTNYWRGLAAPGALPRRAQVDPSDFTALLPQVFILGRRTRGVYPFRLVGGLVADLHGRDLRSENFLSLWRLEDQFALQTAMELARRGLEPVIAHLTACADDPDLTLPMEVLLAPLIGADGEADRYLGLYQPLARTARLEGRAIRRLELGRLENAAGEERVPHLKLASVDGRRVG